MDYQTGLYVFCIAMVIIGPAYLYWRKATDNGSNVAKVVTVAVSDVVDGINALIITPTAYLFQHITEEELMEVFNGWYTWQNKPIIICQSASATELKLERWDQQCHSISEDIPSKTPQELGAITEWESVVRPVYERKRGLLENINTMMMIGIFGGLCLAGFLYYSSYTEAAGV